MSGALRILVTVGGDRVVTATRADTGAEIAPRRTLRRVVDPAHGGFPLPPADEAPGARDLARDGDPAAIAAVYSSIVARNGEAVERFGDYLFDTLLGTASWSAIERAAEDAAAESLELALSWADDASELYRLNWEMMRSPAGFLAAGGAGGGLPVAITRIVAVEATRTPGPVVAPPRVLFVVGAAMSDPAMRPGAELMGLLRRLKRSGRSIHSRVLERASPDSIRAAMEKFRPDVVHFICHGGVDRDGRGFLELTTDEEGDETRRYAEQLLEFMRLGSGLPKIVVLSACHTADSNGGRPVLAGPDRAAPLAAQLIRGGVPVVLGMAGRVSDRASRLFTRGFGEALAGGEPLVRATAEARRIGFADGAAAPHRSVDWGFPAVFLASGVDPGYQPVQVEPGDAAAQLEGLIIGYDLERRPVFCGRERFFEALDEILAGPGRPAPERRVLAIYVNSTEGECGRTRLLRELAIQALRDGHLPVLALPRAGDGSDPPCTLEDLGRAVADAIARMRSSSVLGLDMPPGQLGLLSGLAAEQALADPGIDPEIAFQLRSHRRWVPAAVRRAIQLDLEALLEDARDAYELFRGEHTQIVLLLGDVETYATGLHDLFEGGVLSGNGVGARARPIPVVMTFSTGHAKDAVLRDVAEERWTRRWLNAMPLRPFEANGEDLLAYELVLLHPYKNLGDEVSGKAWAFDDEAPAAVRDKYVGSFRRRLKGLPENLGSDVFYTIVEFAMDERFIVSADDEDLVRRGAMP